MNKRILISYANCLCGKIKIKIKGALRDVDNCHCSQWMKTHGNFGSYTSCDENNIIFIKKTTLKWFNSSKIAKRGFCTNCGASFFYKKLNTNKISIAAGMLKNPTKLNTKANIFTKGKMDYYKLDSKLTKFLKYVI